MIGVHFFVISTDNYTTGLTIYFSVVVRLCLETLNILISLQSLIYLFFRENVNSCSGSFVAVTVKDTINRQMVRYV